MNSFEVLQKYEPGKSPEFQGDDFLWRVYDYNLGEKAIPHIVTGAQAEGFARNGHYDLELVGPNPTSAANLAQKSIEEIRALHGDFKLPPTAAETKAQLEARVAELEAQLANRSRKGE